METDCESFGRCGDGVLQAAYEACEGADLGGATCADVVPQRPHGVLRCDAACGFDTTDCTWLELVMVPGGTFQRDETPTNLSTVSAFRMGKYEVTRAQFMAVMGTDPSDAGASSGTEDPVQMVNWYHAITFCNKLSLQEGLTPVYTVTGVNFTTLTFAQVPTTENATWNAVTANWSANGYRLPTEMEWMWAAMGADVENPGAVNTTGYLKAFAGSDGSNSIGDYVWYATNSSSMTHPTGVKLPNELGFSDLSGNVWEFVWDWYSEVLPLGSISDYRGQAGGTDRISHGGAWSNQFSYCSIAFRDFYAPFDRGNGHGFRVVRH